MSDGVRRKNATRESTNTLKAWLNEHKKNPYPTKGEKIMLAIITKMTLTQVKNKFYWIKNEFLHIFSTIKLYLRFQLGSQTPEEDSRRKTKWRGCPKTALPTAKTTNQTVLGKKTRKVIIARSFPRIIIIPKSLRIFIKRRSFDFRDFFSQKEDETHGAPIVRLDDKPAVSAVQHLHNSDLLETHSPSR